MSSIPSGSNNVCTKSSAHQNYAENILSQQFNFFDNKELCDVVLIAGNDGKRISAHRLVLAAASEYFKAMFIGSHREAFEEEIKLNEVRSDVLEILVKYCYTGLLDFPKDLMENILVTANFLQLSTAVAECCDFWISQLDPTNCLGLVTFAERHNCKSLLKSATEYSCTHFIEVCKNDEFKQLNAEELRVLLLNESLDVASEENVFNAFKLWVEHDLDNRKKYIPNLLNSIRLPLLSPRFIVNDVEKFCDLDECIKPIKEAYRYHLLSNRQSMICRSKRRLGNNFTLLVVSWGSDKIQIHSYCLQKDSWSVLGNLEKNIFYCGMNILDDKLFIVGGWYNARALSSVQCLNLNKMMLTPVNEMQTERYGLAVVVLKESLYAIGGYNGIEYLNTAERWDSSTQAWNYVAPMNSGRFNPGAAVLNDKIYVCGGQSFQNHIVNTVEYYDPVTNVWTLKASMIKNRRDFGVAVLNGYLYAVGGSEGEKSAERYDPVSDIWTFIASLSFNARSCAILENRLIAVGDECAGEYTPETNEWKKLSDSTHQLDHILCVPNHMLPPEV